MYFVYFVCTLLSELSSYFQRKTYPLCFGPSDLLYLWQSELQWDCFSFYPQKHERELVQVLLWVIEFTTDPASVISNWEKDTDSSLNTTKNEGKRVKFEETPIKLQWQPPIGIYYTKEGGSLDWLLELKRNVYFSLAWLCSWYPWHLC